MPVARLRPISRHVAAVDLHGRFQVAVFLVRHDRGLALVDTGFPGWEYAVLTAAESLPRPNGITTILLTHAHADHVGAAAALVAQTGAEVLCGAAEKEYVEGRSLSGAARGLGARLVLAVQHWTNRRKVAPVRVDRTLRDGDLVCGLRVVEVPGHTPGQIALVHERDRVLLCADALFNVGGELGYDPVPGMTADVARADETLRRLAELGVDDLVPSHGPAILGNGPARIREFLDRRRG